MLEKPIGKTVKFTFDKNIYPAAAVRAAAKDYSGAADFELSKLKSGVSVTISNMPPGREEELRGEFLNYVLYLMKAGQV